MSLVKIAKQLTEMDESIVLIYAFNGTGKTQLSVAYKNATKEANDGKHAGVYYNAFSEDLFVWDNDEVNDGADVKLALLPSSLNQFHSFLYEDEQAIWGKLAAYSPKYRFKLNMYDDLEKGIESVSFFIEGKEDVPIKISRGEERIFVWCLRSQGGVTASLGAPPTLFDVAAHMISAIVLMPRPKPWPSTQRMPAASAVAIMRRVFRKPPCFITLTLTMSAASALMMLIRLA